MAPCREQDQRDFSKAQLLFWMLCATGGHAKNFSRFLRPGGRYQHTPLYDVLSADPVLGDGSSKVSPFNVRMATAERSRNARWTMRDILHRHWLALGSRRGVVTEGGRHVQFLIDDTIARTPQVIAAVRTQLPEGFPMWVADSIFDGLQDAANRLPG